MSEDQKDPIWKAAVTEAIDKAKNEGAWSTKNVLERAREIYKVKKLADAVKR